MTQDIYALTAVLRWNNPGARRLRVKVYANCADVPITDTETDKEEYRLAAASGIHYTWGLYNAADGTPCSGKMSFLPTGSYGRYEETDNTEKFGKARHGAVFCCPCNPLGLTALPEVDESQPLSPWYSVKTYTNLPKPSYDDVKAQLPEPVLGDEDAYLKEAYDCAWKIAYDIWLIDPPIKDQSVFPVNGCPYWAGQGSSVDYDTSFIMMYAKYSHGAFPYIRAIDNIYARQHENGFIIKEGTSNNYEVFSSAPAWTAMGGIAWAEWENYVLTGDRDRIRKVFLPLVKYYEWYRIYMESADGHHPDIQAGHGDWGVANEASLLIYAVYLEKMAALNGREDMRAYFAGQAVFFTDYIETNLWDEAHGIYNSTINGHFSTEYIPGKSYRFIRSFDALATGLINPERAESMLAMLLDPLKFMGKYGIRSLAEDSDYYMVDAGRMLSADKVKETIGYDFRRTVWPPNIIYAIRAIRNYGKIEDAVALAEKYTRAVAEIYAKTGDIWEYSWDDIPEKAGNPQFVGWSGFGPIACLIEYILGFTADAPSETLHWDIRRHDRHGIKNFVFSGIRTSLVCIEAGNKCEITIEADRPYTLIVNGIHTFNIQAGMQSITFSR